MNPVLVMPSPRQHQAGATWVIAMNWARACERRYGGCSVLDAGGSMDMSQVLAATGLHSSRASTQIQSKVRRTAGILYKDGRSLARATAQRRVLRKADVSAVGPWVWQRHELFQSAGFDLAARASVPLVLFVDAPIVWEASKWGTRRPIWGRLVERFGETPQLKRADLVLCVSDEVASACMELGADPARVVVTPCTADPADYDGVDDHREALGLTEDLVIGWFGSFRSFHHLDLLVEAVAQVSDAYDDVSLLLVGDGADRDRILRFSDDLGVRCVAPGAVTHDQIPSYMRTIDIAVLPAGRDQDFHYSPLKLKEFLAAGRPTVAPRLGEMARVLTHGTDALLYEAGNRDMLAKEISALVANPSLRRGLGTAGRATCYRLFSIDQQLQKVDAKLKEIDALSEGGTKSKKL